MSNKQKVIDLLEDFKFLISTDYCINGAESRLEAIKRIADEIDALYHWDCSKCKKFNPVTNDCPAICVNNYEEAEK